MLGLKIYNYLKAERIEIKLFTFFNILYDKYSLEMFLQRYMQSPVFITFTLHHINLNKLGMQLSKDSKCVRAGGYGTGTARPIIWLGNTTSRKIGPLHVNFEVCFDTVFVNI